MSQVSLPRELAFERDVLLGVDLGGTKIAASLVTVDGQLIGTVESTPTPAKQGPQAMLEAIADLIERLLRPEPSVPGSVSQPDDDGAVGADGATSGRQIHPLAIGIGSAGVIDTETGMVVSATDAITGWTGTNLAGGVELRLAERGLTDPSGSRLRVSVDNDVNAYAAGEVWKGAGLGGRSALMVAVGTGVGGALVFDGAVLHGAHFLAGEIGHMPSTMAAGERCTCGKDGHLEAIAAGPQIARRYREATGDHSVTTALEVERRAGHGDETAQRVYHEAAVALGRAIAQVVTAVDPEHVIISGGLARSGELWWGPLRRTVTQELVGFIADSTELIPAALGTNAPIIGAARIAWQRYSHDAQL